MNKKVNSLQEAIRLSGLKNGMTVSFHHHLRNGDYVLNLVMDEIARMGLRDIKVNASSLFDTHMPLLEHIENGVVTGVSADYVSRGLGEAFSRGILPTPLEFRTHGGRPFDIQRGKTPIDVAFIGAPTADDMGNCTGKIGPSACGSLGYAFADAEYAKKVVVVTDNLVPSPLKETSISGEHVDFVVEVDAIGDPAGIVSGTTRITRDPVGLVMAKYAARVIEASGLLKDGFSFQTGAGGASLAAAKYLKDIMLEKKICGSFGMGGITGYLVEMLRAGCFEKLYDVQCFDLGAVESIRQDPRHQEITAIQYAAPDGKSLIHSLDAVILGATEIDTEFNVNVHTDSAGVIMGGSGGHSDTAAGAKMSMIIAPLFRARLPIVTDRVGCISTPGKDIDVLVTQGGIAVNPKNKELKQRLLDARLPVLDIEELKAKAEKITGIPKKIPMGDRVVAKVYGHTGEEQDQIYNIL